MSIVAIARPAPFTKQPMLPSIWTYWRLKEAASTSLKKVEKIREDNESYCNDARPIFNITEKTLIFLK
jgi:hypothetical protein